MRKRAAFSSGRKQSTVRKGLRGVCVRACVEIGVGGGGGGVGVCGGGCQEAVFQGMELPYKESDIKKHEVFNGAVFECAAALLSA